MNARLAGLSDDTLHKIQQVIKWTVYTLLIVNFVFYLFEDVDRAIHALTEKSTFLDWTSEFANSIDLLAWFLLLVLLELETYVLEDEDWKGWTKTAVHATRLVCIVMIGHTIFAYGKGFIDYSATRPVENVATLCDLADRDITYVYNLEYTEITANNCDALSSATEFYWLANDPLVTDMEGLELERNLVLVDLIEAVVWLLILLAIEVVVRVQEKGVAAGQLISTMNRIKLLLYLVLVGIAVYWATLSHWLYVWDEALWIGGFSATETDPPERGGEITDPPE